MARVARLVVPGAPLHVTQRGNCRETTFFGEADDRIYRDLPVHDAVMTTGLRFFVPPRLCRGRCGASTAVLHCSRTGENHGWNPDIRTPAQQ